MRMLDINQSSYLIQQANKSLGLSDRVFLENLPYMPKIRDIRQNKDYGSMLGLIFTDASALSGVTTALDQTTANDLMRMIEVKYSSLSIFEIYKAFENERYNVNKKITPHYNYFNASYVSQILDNYIDWRQTKRVDLDVSVFKKQNTPLLQAPDTAKIMEKAVNNAYDNFVNNGYYDGIAKHLFEHLVEVGKIKADLKTRHPQYENYILSKYAIAKRQIEKEASSLNTDRGQMSKARDIIKQLDSNQIGYDVLNARVMRLILNDFFAKQKKEKAKTIF